MKITLSLSNAQARRLEKLARHLNVTPKKLAVVQLFSSFDAVIGKDAARSFREVWPDMLASYGRGVAGRVGPFESLEYGLADRNHSRVAPAAGQPASASVLTPAARFSRQQLAVSPAAFDSFMPKFRALVYRTHWKAAGMPSDEAGPTIWVEGPHNSESALNSCATWLRAGRRRELDDARAILITDDCIDHAELDQDRRWQAVKRYAARYANCEEAGNCFRDIEVHRVEDWTATTVNAAVRKLAPTMTGADQLMIFSSRHDVLPGADAETAAAEIMREAFSDPIALGPENRLSWRPAL